MTRFLLDEMYPPAAAALLRIRFGHDAFGVREVGLGATPDVDVAEVARAQGRVLVTENVADFAAERDLAVLFVLKRTLPSGGGLAAALAARLDAWAKENPDPYLGHHWP